MRWTPEKLEELRSLALAGLVKAEIATRMGATLWAVGERARQLGVKLALRTPEQRRIFAERARLREQSRNERKKAFNHKKRLASREAVTLSVAPSAPIVRPKLPIYELRKAFTIGEMSKTQQRAFLAEAVRNTAQMQSGEA